MNREQFDRESEELSMVCVQDKLTQLQEEMALHAGWLNKQRRAYQSTQHYRGMANVANDPAFQKQMAAQMRAMPLILTEAFN